MSTDGRQLNITHAGAPMQPRTMYDERFLVPMRRDLTEVGFEELRTPDEVDEGAAGQAWHRDGAGELGLWMFRAHGASRGAYCDWT